MLTSRLVALLLLVVLSAQPTTVSRPFEQLSFLPTMVPGSDQQLFQFNDDEYRTGFIDATGKVVIAPAFDGHVGQFVDGLATVTGDGYIDESGNWVIQGDYVTTSDFSEGLARVHLTKDVDEEQYISYIDTAGQVVFKAPRFRTGDFSEGLAWYQGEGSVSWKVVSDKYMDTNYPGLFGFIDQTGKIVIEPRFYFRGTFSDGLAAVAPQGECYANTHQGSVGVTMPWTHYSTFGGGGWGMGIATCPFGFIDKTGNFAIEPKFEVAADFAEGMAAVRIDGRWGFIDRDGEVAIPTIFEEVKSFREGLAAVKLNGKWGFIDSSGQVVVVPRFVWVDSFSDSLAVAGRLVDGQEEKFYIDRQGQIAVAGPYENATPFVNGLAAVLYPDFDEGYEAYVSYINKSGAVVFEYPF